MKELTLQNAKSLILPNPKDLPKLDRMTDGHTVQALAMILFRSRGYEKQTFV